MRCFALFLLVATAGCTDAPDTPSTESATAPAVPLDSTADLSAFFPEGSVGAFVGYDTQSGVTTRYGATDVRRTPASTFKIFNSLAALDAEAVADEHEVVEWDGVDRGSSGWNESQDLATAFRRSTVWVYQELARRMGRDTLQAYLDREGFGNTTLSDSLAWSWLDGSLRVSPEEQIAFLRRLRAGETGFSDRAERIVKDIMIEDTTDGVVRGKSGWALREGENLGWWVGWLERGDEAFFFATTVESDDSEFEMRGVRRGATNDILRHLGVR